MSLQLVEQNLEEERAAHLETRRSLELLQVNKQTNVLAV